MKATPHSPHFGSGSPITANQVARWNGSAWSALGSGAGNGPLAERPKHYVPFMVPVLDEAVTLEQAWLYKKLKQQGQANDLAKPEPVYRWVYRPELQFSTYKLKVQDILREQSDGLSSSLYGNDVPMIATSDNLVRLMYGLLQSNQLCVATGAGLATLPMTVPLLWRAPNPTTSATDPE